MSELRTPGVCFCARENNGDILAGLMSEQNRSSVPCFKSLIPIFLCHPTI